MRDKARGIGHPVRTEVTVVFKPSSLTMTPYEAPPPKKKTKKQTII